MFEKGLIPTIKHYLPIIVLGLCLVILFFVQVHSDWETDEREGIAIIVLDKSQPSLSICYQRVLDLIGLSADVVELRDLDKINLDTLQAVILPSDAACVLENKDITRLQAEVKSGLCLITEGYSELAKSIGIWFSGEEVLVQSIIYKNRPELEINWIEEVIVKSFAFLNIDSVYKDKKTGIPVLAGGKFGKGSFLFLGTSLDKIDGHGYSRFPFFHETLIDYLSYRPLSSRQNLGVYYDWGYNCARDPLEVAALMEEYGINRVHFSGWYPQEISFEYMNEFINACHARGIRVYCWLELPMVSQQFWLEHPEWREKTAANEDAHIDWRYLMALDIPECMEAVQKIVKELINEYDWDGVDLAEIYYESPALGFEAPHRYTPMNNAFRDQYRKLYGIDPVNIFNSTSKHYFEEDKYQRENLIDFRVQKCTELNRKMIDFLQDGSNFNKEIDTIVTQIDSFFDEGMRADTGVDSKSFIKLQKTYGFTLQVEDPFTLWSLGPDRYGKIGAAYKNIAGDNSEFFIDMNIVDRYGDVFPVSKQTGLELLMLIAEAVENFDEISLYSFNSINDYDYNYIQNTLAVKTKVKKTGEASYLTFSPSQFFLDIDTREKDIYINDRLWPCFNDRGVIVPSGENTIVLIDKKTVSRQFHITGINGTFKECSYSGTDITLKYNDKRKVYVTLNKTPQQILISGYPVKVPIYEGNAGVTILLPAGDNEVLIIK